MVCGTSPFFAPSVGASLRGKRLDAEATLIVARCLTSETNAPTVAGQRLFMAVIRAMGEHGSEWKDVLACEAASQ